VLDSGCGPASWTLEMAEKYPNSKFHGVDIAGAFPETLPANLELITGNIAKHIPFPDNTFDYVHQRLLIGGFTEENWESVGEFQAFENIVYY
jgi:ubiquinone/menaquinone biosynthesis C-methylase UbiE